jgi:hypothetical protein
LTLNAVRSCELFSVNAFSKRVVLDSSGPI